MRKSQRIKIDYETEATPRDKTADGLPVFCGFDELVTIKDLKPNPANPNEHDESQIRKLAGIIAATGWRAPITISKQSGYIVRGHGRRLAAIKLEATEVPVEYQDYASEAEEYADLIADNRIAELATINAGMLTDLLTELDTGEIPIELTGYDEEDIMALLAALAGDGDTEDDGADTIAVDEERVCTKPGDLWCLGPHRLLCGDSTVSENYSRLMQGEKAQMLFTDPPYGVSYQSQSGNWEAIDGDDLRDDDLMKDLLVPALRQAVSATEDTAAFYIWHASSTRRDFEDAMKMVGLMEKQYLIWAKNAPVLGHADYQWTHEPCYYAEKAGQRAKFVGDRSQRTVWKVTLRSDEEMATIMTGGLVLTDGKGAKVFVTDKPPKGKKVRYIRVNDGDKPIYLHSESKQGTLWEVARESKPIHPTQKPVELAQRAIENSSERNDIVLDIFAGSGGTLIAAELTKRRGYCIELEPRYIDGIIRRYLAIGRIGEVSVYRDDAEYDGADLLPPEWFE